MGGMARATTIRFALLAVVVAAWAVPLVRAFRLLNYAYGVADDSSSINAANDVWFAESLVLSYSFSLAVAAPLAWVFPSTRTWPPALPLAASLLIAGDVIRLQPESVIVLFPTMDPFRPARFSLVVALVGVCILWLHGRRPRHDERVAASGPNAA